MLALTRNNERRSCLVDENGVDFVHDRKIKIALNHLFEIGFQIVAQIVETEFVIRSVRNIAVISDTLLLVVHSGNDNADGKSHKAVHFPHPLRVAPREVIVYRNNMHAFSGECVKVRRERCNERLSFTRSHFCDTPLMQTDTADDLYMEMTHSEHAPACFAESGECVV